MKINAYFVTVTDCGAKLKWKGKTTKWCEKSYSKASGMVEKGRMGAVFSMACAVAKQFAAVSLSPSIDSITKPRLYQETWSVGSSLKRKLT